MVLETEQPQPAVLGNAFQMFASAAQLHEDGEARESSSTASEDTSYEIVGEPGNATAGLKVTGEESAQPGEKAPSTPTQNFLNEISHLKQLISKHRAENITYDIKSCQLERDNEDLNIELSRTKMALAKEKNESAKRKQKYERLLEDVQSSPDKLSKKLVQYKRSVDELETQLKTDLEAQKVFWQEINQQLHKEVTGCVEEITQLNEALEQEKANRVQEKQDAKSGISELELKLEDALQDKAEMQIQFERLKVENAKLRQEKTQISTDYEEKISKMGARPNPEPEEQFSTEEMMRMMQETLGVDDVEAYDE